mmetsp:Transcript_95024/g.307475  ORF Transcript_95024/g.307475 Transcript_95024/m.307475 type:complete len:257 (+) Transcript_95024:4678-5448(+)
MRMVSSSRDIFSPSDKIFATRIGSFSLASSSMSLSLSLVSPPDVASPAFDPSTADAALADSDATAAVSSTKPGCASTLFLPCISSLTFRFTSFIFLFRTLRASSRSSPSAGCRPRQTMEVSRQTRPRSSKSLTVSGRTPPAARPPEWLPPPGSSAKDSSAVCRARRCISRSYADILASRSQPCNTSAVTPSSASSVATRCVVACSGSSSRFEKACEDDFVIRFGGFGGAHSRSTGHNEPYMCCISAPPAIVGGRSE